MNRKNSIIFICTLLFTQLAFSQVSQDRLHYIDKYKAIAQEEMERTGVPASIKLAQAILESNGGKSVLSRKANNHFGIKCGGDWNDRSFYRVDDEKDKKGNPIESCFRVYKNPESSFIAHSEFLRNNKRYDFLFSLDHKDYQGWAYGLKKAGYATNPKYPTLLINIIENYELHQFDDLFEPGDMIVSTDDEVMMEEIVMLDKKKRAEALKRQSIKKLNDISVIYALQDDTPETISIKTDVPIRRLFRYNEALTKPGQAIPENTVVFLQPKRNAFRGRKKFHQVKDGENIAQISQKYGIRIDKLQKRNRLDDYQEPLEGAILKIRGKRVAENMLIPTREVYVAGKSNRKQEVRNMDKYATSLSDFEAPQSVVKTKKINTIKKKKRGFFNFGKKKNVASKREASPPIDSYKAAPNYEEDIVEVEESKNTGEYTAPNSSGNYQSQDASPNATFKENSSIVVPSTPTTPTTTYNTSPSSSTTYNNGANSPTYNSTPSNTTTSYNNGANSTTQTSSSSTTTSSPVYNSTPSTVVTTPQIVSTQYHTVLKGETLYRLSKIYGKSVDYIKQVNNLNSNTISIGQKLIVN